MDTTTSSRGRSPAEAGTIVASSIIRFFRLRLFRGSGSDAEIDKTTSGSGLPTSSFTSATAGGALILRFFELDEEPSANRRLDSN